MATVVDCHTAIEAAIAGFPSAGLPSLPSSSGFAFQAYVYARVGRELADRGWNWTHPAPNQWPTFAATNGGSLDQAQQVYSYIANNVGDRAMVQELTVVGLSGAAHDLDAVLIRQPAPQVHDGNPSGSLIGTILECKNYGRGVPLGTGRELLGLSADLGALAQPARSRLILISAHSISTSTTQFMDAWKLLSVEGASPTALDDSATWIRNRIRF